jgi:hypothetical protein
LVGAGILAELNKYWCVGLVLAKPLDGTERKSFTKVFRDPHQQDVGEGVSMDGSTTVPENFGEDL